MDVLNETGSQEIDALREPLAAAVVARQFEARPELARRYGASGRSKCLEDARFHLGYLSEAIAAIEPALFVHYIEWLTVTLGHRGIPTSDIQRNLELLRAVLIAELTGDTSRLAVSLVNQGLEALEHPIDEPPSFFRDDQSHAVLIKEYWAALLSGDRRQASEIVLDAVRRGTTVRDNYFAVIRTCQYEIGRLWQINRMSVAQEHYCSAVTQQIMSQLYPYIFLLLTKRGPAWSPSVSAANCTKSVCERSRICSSWKDGIPSMWVRARPLPI